MNVLTEEMEILVHCGVHGRVAVQLAEIADAENVILHIKSGNQQVSCNSILELLGLALIQGTRISVHAQGEKAKEALLAVRNLLMEKNTF